MIIHVLVESREFGTLMVYAGAHHVHDVVAHAIDEENEKGGCAALDLP